MSDRKAKGKHKKDHEKGAYLKITETIEKIVCARFCFF